MNQKGTGLWPGTINSVKTRFGSEKDSNRTLISSIGSDSKFYGPYSSNEGWGLYMNKN